ncbi:MAG TPA: hypothetical protein VFP87_11490, partial [Chitinophagaceae bacterium]|nr:hypothetical protein [Chitinophagaceae bacterium]
QRYLSRLETWHHLGRQQQSWRRLWNCVVIVQRRTKKQFPHEDRPAPLIDAVGREIEKKYEL